MDAVLLVIAVAALAAAIAWYFARRGVGEPIGGGRSTSRDSGRRAPPRARRDPMAEVVSSHADTLDPDDAVVAELRLRAQANRVAAEAHERDAAAGPDEAAGHLEAATKHRAAADELEQRIPHARADGHAHVQPPAATTRRAS